MREAGRPEGREGGRGEGMGSASRATCSGVWPSSVRHRRPSLAVSPPRMKPSARRKGVTSKSAASCA